MGRVFNQKLWFFVIFSSYASYAQMRPNTAIFLIPQVADSDITTDFVLPEFKNPIDFSSTEDGKYTLKFPIKQDDGTYKLVEVTYIETDTTRTISIPGQGEINVIKNESGDYNFTLTPEQIKDSSNVSCNVGFSGKGTCTIEPFVTMVGNKVLSSDKLVVDYTEGQNLVVAGGTAHNLKLTEPGATTDFNKSETQAGDSLIEIKFSKNTEKAPVKDLNVGGISIPMPSVPGVPNIPMTSESLRSQKDMQISLSTSKLVHTVTNPANREQSAVKFKVNDGGVSSKLIINNQDHLKISLDAQTQGGISYNSDPFSDKNVKVETTAPVRASFVADNSPENLRATLNFQVDAKDKAGNTSVVSIVDTRDDKKKNTVTSYGQTVFNISQATLIDRKTYQPVESDSPVAFEVASEHLIVKNEKDNGKFVETEVKGLAASGEINPKTKNDQVNLSANSVSMLTTKNGKLDRELSAGNIVMSVNETDTQKKHLAMVDHAYYNNGETKLNLTDGALIDLKEYKNEQSGELFNGKRIKKDTYILGNNATIDNSGAFVDISGGVAIRELRFYDNSKLTTLAGSGGSLKSSDYNVTVSDGFSAINEESKDGKPVYTQVSAANVSGTNKNDIFKILNSNTSGEVLGKSTSGKDILQIKHTSSGLEYKKGDGSSAIAANELNVNVVDADKVKYGVASFKDLKVEDIKDGKKQTVEIVGAQAAFYTDETDPTNKLRQGEMSLSKLGVKSADYSVDVIAKDANGADTKYKIMFFESGANKNYKIFTADGSRVHLDGVDKDNRHASVLFESIEYLQDDKFKSTMAKNLSGSLITLKPDSEILHTFNASRVDAVESINGDYRAFVVSDASITQKDFSSTKDTEGSLSFSTLSGVEQRNSDGSKNAFVKGTGVNLSGRDKNRSAKLNDLNFEVVQAKSIKFGEASFKDLKVEEDNKDTKNGKKQTLEIVGAQAAFYTDETDPTNKLRQGEMSLSKLGVKSADYSVDVIAKDANGAATKYKIMFFESGANKNYKIFTADGSRVHLDGVDKDNRHASVLFESIEYLQDDKFKATMAKNLSGSLREVTPTSEKLSDFNIARIDMVESLDGSSRQFLAESGSLNHKDGEKSGSLSFNSLTGSQTRGSDGKKDSYIKGAGVNLSGSDKTKTTKLNDLNFELVQAKSIKFGEASFKDLKVEEDNKEIKDGKKQTLEIVGAQAAFYTDETDPTNKLRQGEMSLSKLGVKSADYSVDVIAKDANGAATKYKIMFFESGANKNYKIFTADGSRVHLDGVDKDNRHASVLFESIEYLQDEKFKSTMAKNLSGSLREVTPTSEKLSNFNIARIEMVESLDGSSRQFVAETGSANYRDGEKSGSLSFNSLTASQAGSQTGKKDSYIKGVGVNLSGSDKTKAAKLNDLNFELVQAKSIMFGEASFKDLKVEDTKDGKKQTLEIVGAQAAFYTDETDPTNKLRQGEMSLLKLGVKSADYSVDVIAKDANGEATKYKIMFFESGANKNYKIFTADGSRVHLDGVDKDNRHASVLFESIEYLQDDKFKSTMAKNLSGSLREVTPTSEKLSDFNIARIDMVESLDGSSRQFAAQTGSLNHKDGEKSGSLSFNSLTGSQAGSQTGKKDSYIKGVGVNLSGTDKSKSAKLNDLNFELVEAKSIKFGEASFKDLKVEDIKDGKKQTLEIVGAQAAFYTDETDPTSKLRQGEMSLSKLGVKSADYSVDVIAKDANGAEGKYKIFMFEQGATKSFKIFGEDGAHVDITGVDKDNNHARVLFDSISYMQDDKFKQVFASNLSGEFKTLKPNDEKLASFSFAKVEGGEALDGSSKYLSLNTGKFSHTDGKTNSATFDFKEATFSETNYLDTKDFKAQLNNAAFNVVEYKDSNVGKNSGIKTEANLSFGSLLANQITKPHQDKITIVSAKDIDIFAVDYNELVKFNGKIGGLDIFQDANIQTIDIKDLEKFKLEDTSSGVNALFDAKKILRVVTKDAAGVETGSYLLINSAALSASDPKNGVTANFKVGVLEFFQDKLTKQNIILDVDVSGRISVDKTKSPVAAQVDFALKGKRLTTDKQKYVSADGNTVSNYFAIKPIDQEGRLDHLKLSAGPSFLKDAISLEAKGGKNGGKSLSFSFEQDKKNGTYFIRAEFIEGEKVKIKLFPFTLESKMEGADAIAELMLTPKGQNYMNHMEIISNVVSSREITDWLEVSDGGMLIARTGTLGGFGFEMMYHDEEYFKPESEHGFLSGGDKAHSIGGGIFRENSKGDRTSVGVLLSGDSEVSYQTNGRGVLQIFGVKMNQSGEIPATINLYMRKDYADGDSIYGGVSADMASYMVDEEKLSKNAAFYDGGRGHGKLGASIAYSKKLSENSRLTLALGANNNFSQPAFCLTYTKTFGGSPAKPVVDLSKDTMKVVNKYAEQRKSASDFAYTSGPTVKGAISMLDREVQDLELKYEEAKTIEKLKLALGETLAAIDNKTLTVSNADRKFNITPEDLEILKRIEGRNFKGKSLAQEMQNLATMVRYDIAMRSGVDDVYAKASEIRKSMEQLTQEYDQEESNELFDEYSKKLAELSKLGG